MHSTPGPRLGTTAGAAASRAREGTKTTNIDEEKDKDNIKEETKTIDEGKDKDITKEDLQSARRQPEKFTGPSAAYREYDYKIILLHIIVVINIS